MIPIWTAGPFIRRGVIPSHATGNTWKACQSYPLQYLVQNLKASFLKMKWTQRSRAISPRCVSVPIAKFLNRESERLLLMIPVKTSGGFGNKSPSA
jgi:hypothetical protein